MKASQRVAVLLLVCGLFSGCMTLNPLSRIQSDTSVRRNSDSFDLSDPVDRQNALAQISHESIRQEASQTARGTLVSVVIDFDHQFLGLFQSVSHDRLCLTRCLCKEPVQGPDGRSICKSSYTPVQEFEISKVTCFGVISPTVRDKCSQDHDDDIEGVVTKSGRQVRIVADANSPANSAESLQDRIIRTPLGSQVSVVDESNHRFIGIVVSVDRDRVQLMNCVWKETVPAPNGQTQLKISHVPYQVFDHSTIKSFSVNSSGAAGYQVPELESDCEEFCIDGFLSNDGRLYGWRQAQQRRLVE